MGVQQLFLLPTPPAVMGLGFRRRLSLCLSVLPHDTSKTGSARITKLDIEMTHGEV